MSKSKSTPGPWKVETQETTGTLFIIADDGILEPVGQGSLRSLRVTIACIENQSNEDARLIASAPELLEALQEIVTCSKYPPNDLEGHEPITYHIDGAWIDKALEAIALATGE